MFLWFRLFVCLFYNFLYFFVSLVLCGEIASQSSRVGLIIRGRRFLAIRSRFALERLNWIFPYHDFFFSPSSFFRF